MISTALKWTVMATAILLMAIYMYLNGSKLTTLSAQWEDFRAGSAAPVAKIELAGEMVYQHRLKTSDIFDTTGKRMVSLLPVPEDVFASIVEQPEATRLVIGGQDISLSGLADKSALLAITTEQKIYLVANDELKSMMTIIWNEQRRARKFIRCTSPDLCASLRISSRDWGPLEGPYSDSEFSPSRRGLPRGRWFRGPGSLLSIQSRVQQKVQLQINLLAVNPDQHISFRGSASSVKKIDTKSTTLSAGGRSLYLAVYVLALDLTAGGNGLELNYSKWDKADSGSNGLAAYVTAIAVSRPAVTDPPPDS